MRATFVRSATDDVWRGRKSPRSAAKDENNTGPISHVASREIDDRAGAVFSQQA